MRRATGSIATRGAGAAAVALAASLCAGISSAGSAAGAVPPPTAADPGTAAAKQKEAQARLEALERAMDRLAELLERTEPRNAAKLRLAFRRSRESLIREDMERILQFLQARQLDRALEAQKDVRADLEELMRILLERDVEPAELLEAIRRVEGILRDVDGLRKDEAAQRDATERAAQGAQGASERIQDLAERQREIARRTAEAEKDLRGIAPDQGRIREDAERLAEEMGAEGARASEGARGSEGAKGSEGSKGEEGGRGAQGGRESAEEAVERAAAAMRDAEKHLADEKKPDALKSEKEAIRELEGALRKVEERLERLVRQELEAQEEEHEERAGGIAERMERPLPLLDDPEGVPGRRNVQNAKGEMGQAASKLGQGNPASASKSQRNAVDELDRAKKRLEETLETLWQAFKDRLLEYLRQEFAAMLARQKEISGGTRDLDRRLRALSAPPERGEEQRSQMLAGGENELAKRMQSVIEIVIEDGTTVVFPRILEDVKEDMEAAAARLSRIDAGPETQRIQAEIERALAEIIEAIQEAQRKPPPPSPPQPGNPRSSAGPLLPGSTELRMIRDMEARVRDGTKAIDATREDGQLPPARKSDLERIRRKQVLTEELTRKMARRVGM